MVVCQKCNGNKFNDRCQICDPMFEGICPGCGRVMHNDGILMWVGYHLDDGMQVDPHLRYYTCKDIGCGVHIHGDCLIFIDNVIYKYAGSNTWRKF